MSKALELITVLTAFGVLEMFRIFIMSQMIFIAVIMIFIKCITRIIVPVTDIAVGSNRIARGQVAIHVISGFIAIVFEPTLFISIKTI